MLIALHTAKAAATRPLRGSPSPRGATRFTFKNALQTAHQCKGTTSWLWRPSVRRNRDRAFKALRHKLLHVVLRVSTEVIVDDVVA
jgi:hypothetical protein